MYDADRSFSQAGDRLWGDHAPAEAVPYALVSIAASLRQIAKLMQSKADKSAEILAAELDARSED